ncbi:50S ribosomal protein L21 [Ferrimicrobium acidiphilum]|jgi:large subunit ribosomal protein L21|uniref:Large ribosomal subunit protein bL21 n=1 Tax=Ferrimicrobium acidiphilum DSM 19497 TaxID=1121877 RepID=A0A0D8FXW6_9ACTN|nr:50S ribosomal protein L21 [Ferrimicrobium acidiphilum]KJE78065.1 50S ribosomal protein L21 [Ferrimicrobium acidiphilum DSM 19497]MCL5053255.1 50S ribosomal protein L21 [Gammaproteobacteria bacterium]
MYAVVDVGSKQAKVFEGRTVLVERIHALAGDEVSLRPVLFVDDDRVLARSDELARVTVRGEIVDEVKGTKVIGFRYKSKANERKHFGHRQKYTRVKITSIVAE